MNKQSSLQVVGIGLIVIGLIWGIFAFTMDTSVEVGGEVIGTGAYSIRVPKAKVNNVGLMNDKQNYIIGAGLTLFIGVIVLLAGLLMPVEELKESAKPLTNDDEKKTLLDYENSSDITRFHIKDNEDFHTTSKQIHSKYKEFGFNRIVINTITQFMVQKEKNAYIKVTQKNDIIEIEHKNSPKIDIDIISKRKSL